MPDIKLASKITKPIARVLEPYENRLGRLDQTIVAIVEFTTVKRVDVSLEAEAAPAVYLQITGIEIATRDQEDHLRRAQQAMYQLRTARGTIDELTSAEDARRQLSLLGDQIAAGGED
ncbi:hypothetical protein [Sphaerisporangium sp. NPDC051011]|uniref:hypothetical protein n=1 Tax=Sphaerisporangium sp. NPDC051011 TaxID=3155792 RepID=UPI0033FC283B